MLCFESRSRSRDFSRPNFHGLGLGLGLVGPGLGLGLGLVGSVLGLGLGLVGPSLGLGLVGPGLRLGLGLVGSGLVNIPGNSIFVPFQKVSRAQECNDFRTIALISH